MKSKTRSTNEKSTTNGELTYGVVSANDVPNLKALGHKDTSYGLINHVELYEFGETSDDLISTNTGMGVKYRDVGEQIEMNVNIASYGSVFNFKAGKDYFWSPTFFELGVGPKVDFPDNVVPAYSDP